jgi:serine/threonine-protein kinase
VEVDRRERDSFGLCGTVVAGKLRVLEVVGEGGFGVVYRGHHVDFDEPVAIKCLKLRGDLAESEQDALLEKLRAEGKLLLRLSRRTTGIVQALDVGAHVGPTGARIPYLVLEWIEGRTLASELRTRRSAGVSTSLGEAVDLLRPVADALAVAHGEGVAHRDIKPDNLMLPPTGGAKILDFGIAKVLEEATSAADAKTSAAVPVFTPAYGAPEQFEKRRGATGPWTDVFALALVFVEVVGGRQAITGDELIDLYKKVTDPVCRPTLRSVGVTAPSAVESVLQKALAVEPGARYPHAGAFFEALSAAVAAGGDAVRTPSPADPQLLAVAPTEEFSSSSDPSLATVPADPAPGALGDDANRRGEPAARTTEPHALQTARVSLTGPRAPRRSRVGVALGAGVLVVGSIVVALPRTSRVEAPPADQVGEASSPSSPLSEPELGLRTIAQFRDPPSELAGKPLTTTAWRAAAKSFEAACGQPMAPPRWCAGRYFCEAQVSFLHNEFDDAERLYTAASAADPSWAMPHAGLSSVWTQRRKLDRALDEAAVAQQLEPSWWGAIAAGARAYSALDRLDGAIGEYRRALALAPDSAVLLSELALTYHAAGMDSEAEAMARDALKLSPDLVHVRVMLAERALELGDGKEALVQADKALAIAPRHVTSLLARGDALVLLARPDDAREAYARLVEVARSSTSGDLAPRVQQVADALEKNQLPRARNAGSAAAVGVHAPKPGPIGRSKPVCSPQDPLCSFLDSPSTDAPRTPPDSQGSLDRTRSRGPKSRGGE